MIDSRYRLLALAAAVAGAVVAIVLAAVFFHGSSSAFDEAFARGFFRNVGPGWAHVLLDLSSPILSFAVPGLVAAYGVATRRWNLAAVAVAGPAIAIGISEVLLKPVVARLLGPHPHEFGLKYTGSYPSGHETGVSAAGLVLVLLVCYIQMPRLLRAAVITLTGAWMALAAVGLVRNFLHYMTDTIGAVGVSTATVLGVALAVDRVLQRERVKRLPPRHRRSVPV